MSKSVKLVEIDIFNETRGRRVIWDGLQGASITIEPGEIKRYVTVAEWVAEELRTSAKASRKLEVTVYDAGKAPMPPPGGAVDPANP